MKRRRIDVNLNELAQLLQPRTSEKTREVVGKHESSQPEQSQQQQKPNGHGRNPASAYQGANKIPVAHAESKHGDPCPDCGKGEVYTQKEPKPLVRIVGQAFNRLKDLESHMGIPLPATTLWEVVEEAADLLKPARDELIRQAAQGELVHNDDTSMRVLKLERPPEDDRWRAPDRAVLHRS